ncbi:orotate phosphoribosyltransferase [archaeon SCG-AAA382B04]|nr:orotate phosphoribosyltransferase [archaeon SCG-AAA382B04]
MEQRKQKLKEILKKTGALKFGEFKLSSGKKSDYYIDIKKASTFPEFIKLIGKEISEKLEDADRLAGVALGGIPLVVSASIYSKKPYIMIRKQKKEYGTKERIEGEFNPNDDVVMIEDVTTTGNSLLNAIKIIREQNVEIKKSIVVVDRGEGAKELLKKHGVELIPIFESKDLVKDGGN